MHEATTAMAEAPQRQPSFADNEFDDILAAFTELDDLFLTSDLTSFDLDIDTDACGPLSVPAKETAQPWTSSTNPPLELKLEQQQQQQHQDVSYPFVFGAASVPPLSSGGDAPGPHLSIHTLSSTSQECASVSVANQQQVTHLPSWVQSPSSSYAGGGVDAPLYNSMQPAQQQAQAQAQAGWDSKRLPAASSDIASQALAHTALDPEEMAALRDLTYAATTSGPGVASRQYTAEELLAGLDLQDILQPPKVSHAKRIRGHVRRLNELRAVLADKVRQIYALAAENASLHTRARVLELVLACRQEQLAALANYRASPDNERLYICAAPPTAASPSASSGAAAAAAGGGTFPALPPSVDVRELAQMSAPKLLEVFRVMVHELSLTLMALDQQSGAAAGGADALQPHQLALSGGEPSAQLDAQMGTFRSVVCYLGLAHPDVDKFVDMTLSGEVVPVGIEHWMRVVAGLGLSAQQRADAAALHECYAGWLRAIHAERQRLCGALSAALSVNRYGNVYGEDWAHVGDDAVLIHKVHANAVRERALTVLLSEALCTRILTQTQWARLIVSSFPYVYDCREVVRAASIMHTAATRGLPAPLATAGSAAGARGSSTGGSNIGT